MHHARGDGFVDLHSHLVPGVDDGVATVEEAVATLAALSAEGVSGVVTTPHLLVPHLATDADLRRALGEQRRAFTQAAEAAERHGGLPWFALGQEILCPTARDAARAAAVPGLGLGAERYVLVEFGFRLRGRMTDVLQTFLDAGRTPVVAHAERYLFTSMEAGLELIGEWHSAGAVVQVNAGSLEGAYAASSPLAEPLSWALLRAGLAAVVASDHHGIGRRRGVSPGEAFRTLEAAGAVEQAGLLLSTNGRRIRNGDDVVPVPPLA